ncbi:MAG: pilus assembly protein N-terminal domain-containing protein [Caulobacterales bacterium]|nr:pilus assembly protein N-terminal domain-containing protein [Caulobacterales bacterium]
MRRLLTALAFTAAAAAPAAAANSMQVRIDEAQALRLSRDFAAIVVGNPRIADVTAHDPRLLFVTGKTFGETNLLVLDAFANVIVSTHLSVGGPDENRLTLYRGPSRQSYHCPDECQAAPVPGDEEGFFGSVSGAMSDSISSATE